MKNQANAEDKGFFFYDFECVNCQYQQVMILATGIPECDCYRNCGARYRQTFNTRDVMPSLVCIVCPRIIPVQEAA